ncbi:MAG: response regulator [Terracidiphilus sp.]|jgi:DNA-binding NtrC family response regulator
MMPDKISILANRILFVDDDTRVLDGLKRMLHGEIEVETASSGTEGLATIHLFGPFAIVVSDMRMPGLDGAEFLARVRELTPYTVRMLLTGHKDLKRAIAAVNEGQIFRYLAKPCEKDEMLKAICLGLAQYCLNVEAGEMIKEAKDRRLYAASEPPRELFLVKD